MSTPNFCPNCGEDLQKYQENNETTNNDEKPTREDYRRILNEELEKAEEESPEQNPKEDSKGEDLTREDYEEVLERKLEEVREDKQETDQNIDPEVEEAVKKLVDTDREIIEHMRDGLQKDIALDIQDMADGKTDNLRILGD